MERMKTLIGAGVLALVLMTGAAWALDLDGAKAQGLVGEKPDGYVGAVAGGRADVQALVNDINTRRRAQYQVLAQKNGTSVTAVQQIVGQKLISRAGPGGQWVRK
ncbi:MAG: YdbL family protein [Rhodospirillaceae bacterium]